MLAVPAPNLLDHAVGFLEVVSVNYTLWLVVDHDGAAAKDSNAKIVRAAFIVLASSCLQHAPQIRLAPSRM